MEDEACWICLEGPQREPLARPCACPRDVHLRCLSRWCLQQAGRSEERCCRFCKTELPDWKNVLTGPTLPPADPIMVVTLGSVVHKIRVKPGEEGQREFQQEIRRLFNIPSGVDFEVTFRCKAPCTSETIQLEGMSCYHAATHCASLMAAQRMAAAAGTGSGSAPAAASGNGGGSSRASAGGNGSGSDSARRSSRSGGGAPASGSTTPADGSRGPVRSSRLGAVAAVAAGATGAMRRVASSVQSAMQALQGHSSTPQSASRTTHTTTPLPNTNGLTTPTSSIRTYNNNNTTYTTTNTTTNSNPLATAANVTPLPAGLSPAGFGLGAGSASAGRYTTITPGLFGHAGDSMNSPSQAPAAKRPAPRPGSLTAPGSAGMGGMSRVGVPPLDPAILALAANNDNSMESTETQLTSNGFGNGMVTANNQVVRTPGGDGRRLSMSHEGPGQVAAMDGMAGGVAGVASEESEGERDVCEEGGAMHWVPRVATRTAMECSPRESSRLRRAARAASDASAGSSGGGGGTPPSRRRTPGAAAAPARMPTPDGVCIASRGAPMLLAATSSGSMSMLRGEADNSSHVDTCCPLLSTERLMDMDEDMCDMGASDTHTNPTSATAAGDAEAEALKMSARNAFMCSASGLRSNGRA